LTVLSLLDKLFMAAIMAVKHLCAHTNTELNA